MQNKAGRTGRKNKELQLEQSTDKKRTEQAEQSQKGGREQTVQGGATSKEQGVEKGEARKPTEEDTARRQWQETSGTKRSDLESRVSARSEKTMARMCSIARNIRNYMLGF